MKKLAVCLAFLGSSLLPFYSFAISGNEQVELAGAGQYEQLWRELEKDAASKELKTADMHALCFAYSKTKRYNKLMPCLDHLEKLVQRGDMRTRLFGLDDATPTIHLMRGEAMVELGQYANAITEADKAIAWYKKEDSDDQDIMINALTIKALASSFSGKKTNAEKYASELEEVKVLGPLHGDFKSVKAMAIARVNMALGNYQRTYDAITGDTTFAIHMFLDRLVSGAFLTGKNNWAWQELPRSFMVNKALFGMGKLSEAKAGYDQLLKIPQVKDNGEIYWLILYERGQIAERENKPDEAIEFYKKAIEIIESQRTTINTEANKIGFVGDKQQVYGRIVSTLSNNGKHGEAFEYIERSKSRALVDMLAAKQAIPLKAKNAGKFSLTDLDNAEAEVLAQMPVSATEGKSQQREFKSKMVEQIKAIAPETSSLISVSSLPIKELQQLIPNNETVIQYYFQGDSFLGILVTRNSLKTVMLDLTGMDKEVRGLREAISRQDPSALAISQSLYRRLIQPLEGSITHKNVLIIPHGILHYLPFTALSSGDQYFIEKYSVRVLPNASVLKYIKRAGPGKLESILVLGNPDLGDPKYDLPSAQAEAERIASLVPKSKLLLRKQASKSTFRKLSGDYRYIHFASHGEFDPAAPLNSALLLARDGNDNGILTVNELYSLELNADLVTLSACETGLAKISNGDDLIGLTRGFFYSGTSSVIASLWQVDDDATSYLMVQFYEALKKSNKRDALRQAQINTMKKFKHPFFWAAFYLSGNID
ncbi:MAG: CHAT domain-containing protein [Burkholderiales bacterium]|nr:CHAT domain-containing protein [Burkholderiales bacterium]